MCVKERVREVEQQRERETGRERETDGVRESDSDVDTVQQEKTRESE